MFSQTAELYDAIYGSFRDNAAEAAAIAALVRAIQPGAHRILDVGCATGEHAKHLRMSHGFAVDGLDLDHVLLSVARRKVPDAQFFEADMSNFELPGRYDVVMCLFSSIGYLKTIDRVIAAWRCFRHHLSANGVILVEPWFPPGVLCEGPRSTERIDAYGVCVERTSDVVITGNLSSLRFTYRIEDHDGVRTAHEVHELGLFTDRELLSSFRSAGLVATRSVAGATGRGLYIARPESHQSAWSRRGHT